MSRTEVAIDLWFAAFETEMWGKQTDIKKMKVADFEGVYGNPNLSGTFAFKNFPLYFGFSYMHSIEKIVLFRSKEG